MEPAAEKPISRGLITISIMLATVMQAIDTTIANVALPSMQGSMSATQDQISWVLTSYIVAAAIMTPLTGVLAARLGRKKVFLVSVVGFTLSSMLCGASLSLTEIVLFRLLQGVFGAGLVPLSQAVLLDTYPPERHGQAMAMLAMVLVGRLIGRIDTRLLIGFGLCLMVISLSIMATFTIDVSIPTIVWTGVLQGLGFGFVFVPLSTVTFSTLAGKLRTEGTAIFSLLRNIGSSIGISLVVTVLARSAQVNHADLAVHISPFRQPLEPTNLPQMLDWSTTTGTYLLNSLVTREAATIAYLNDNLCILSI